MTISEFHSAAIQWYNLVAHGKMIKKSWFSNLVSTRLHERIPTVNTFLTAYMDQACRLESRSFSSDDVSI